MARYWFPKPYADRVAKLRVTFGFILIAAFLFLSQPTRGSLEVGIPVAALGLALRAWAAGHLEKNSRLAESGPYSLTRNPLYLGTLAGAFGFVIAGRSILLALVFAVVFLLIYLPVIELEEQHLRTLFPAYDAYSRRVPKLVGVPREKTAAVSRFSVVLYLRNREYEAAVAFLIALGWLLFRAYWR